MSSVLLQSTECTADRQHRAEFMHEPPYNVLFLSKDNAGRGILAESLLAHWGHGRFRAFSAGIRPICSVNPLAQELLRNFQLCSHGLRSKSWTEFLRPDSVPLDFVITVGDVAAAGFVPDWPGQPIIADWCVEDPSEKTGSVSEQVTAFCKAYRLLQHRIRAFTDLPISKMHRTFLQRRLLQSGKIRFR